ncbi:hypothetical protein C8R47DRAFT_1179968 [Mycena vitilis]|nr:hypothetical protein C8R47DRAFT_1179968 [Mycena vitilis]
MNPNIEPLPDATRTKLRSTQILTSLAQIVSELLQNSLDAGARQIDIGIDCEEWTCWVRDDGSGLSKDGMDILGTGLEAGRYGTSKAYAPESLDDLSTFGFRGEALASCADICCLEISSRTSRSRQTWSVIVKGSKALYNGPAVRWRRESPGTTLPVRRLSHPTAARTLDAVRHEIEAFALVFPSVSFTLENTHSVRDEKDMLLRIPKVYINRHPVSFCELHQAIDARFASSSFAKHAFDEAGETSLRSTVRRSPRKSEKRPVYVLNLSVPPGQVDNCLEPAKAAVHLRNKSTVTSLLDSTIETFLIRHGFSSEKNPKTNRPASGGNTTSPTIRVTLNLSLTCLNNHSDFPETHPRHLCIPETKELVWTDPHTGEIYVVDTRTGNSYRHSEPPPVDSNGVIPSGPKGRTLSRQMAHGTGSKDKLAMPEWIQKALEVHYLSYFRAQTSGHTAQRFSEYLKAGKVYGDSTSASSRRFRKDDLRNAQVINQVDCKFIACLIDDSSSASASWPRTLVLVDQHAADERVRVEKFLKELCLGYLSNVNAGPTKDLLRRRDLNPPVPTLLTRQEVRQLCDISTRRAFERWGFHFLDPAVDFSSNPEQGVEAGSASGYSQVFVQCIPEVVADKLLLDVELRDFIKAFLAKGENDPPPNETKAARHEQDDEFFWLRALRWCPQQLLDLVNSKACRGAIMFNDSLTHTQCEKLIEQLCETAFPFQCAHGRPSLVPLIDLGEHTARKRRSCRWSKWNNV